ncbi:response regulator [Ectothiorhodospiraceae bacterium BW-2]|nr:response regulator [Ectothiorhodospiraceae bacterium BW-2]
MTAKVTILIVDDQPQNLLLLGEILQPHYRVIAANSGEHALQLADSSSPPALILLDIMMPQMDGYAVLQQLKQRPNTCEIPVLFVTALNDTDDEAYGLAQGAADYITKPLKPAIILARIANQLEMKRMRDLLNDRALQLEHEVQKRTEELQRALQVKQQFLSNISHELNTPINGILGMINLTMTCFELPADAQTYLELAFKSGDALNEILDKIFEYSDTLKHTGDDLYATASSPKKLAEEVVNYYRASATVKGLTLSLEVAEDLPQLLLLDNMKIQRILIQLVDNALKYTAKGGVALQCEFRHNQLHYTIQDSGCGIEPSQQQAIFAPFNQSDNSTRRHHYGTGLGLAIVRELAIQLGATLELESAPAQGSRFSLAIPVQSPHPRQSL